MLDQAPHLATQAGASEIAGDIVTAGVGAGYVGASLLGFIHGVEVVIAGFLVIVLLVLRIRAHVKKGEANDAR